MTKCDFEYTGPTAGRHGYRCRACGHEVQLNKELPSQKIRRQCDGPRGPHSPPGLLRRGLNFTRAAVAHQLRGRPKADQATIDYRLAICQACELFSGEICTHKKCGCRIGGKAGFLNKLAWADQQCPAGHWPAVDTGPPLKVAILSPFFCFGGGVEQWIHSLLTYMPPDVTFTGIGLLTDDRGIYEWDKQGVDYILPLASVVFGRQACQRLADDSDVLIVWGVSSIDHWFPRRPEKPIVFVNHGQGDWSKQLLDGAADWADQFVAVGEAALALRPDSVLIPNGVDLTRCRVPARLRPSARKNLGLPLDAMVIGQIGRLVADKDAHAVARAVQQLVRDGENAWGLLVGKGAPNYIAEARSIARNRLVHVPATPEISQAFAAMDCFLFSSLTEGFGLALVEAWAAGVPTVSTRVGVAEKHPDLYVEVPVHADGPTLAAAVRDAVRGERVQQARRVAHELYSARTMADAWHAFLKSIDPRKAV